MGNNGSLGAVYAGRFIAGLGVGQTVVVAPVYLAEIVRGIPTRHFVQMIKLTEISRLLLLFEVYALASLLALFTLVCLYSVPRSSANI